MNFLKEYATSIIVVSILAVLLEAILPEESSKKYLRVVIGLLVMLIILQPLTALPQYKSLFTLPSFQLTDDDLSLPTMRPYVAESFSRRLALKLEEDIYQIFHKTVSCRIQCTTNDAGQITAIDAIHLQPFTQDIQTYIAETYGLEEAIIQP